MVSLFALPLLVEVLPAAGAGWKGTSQTGRSTIALLAAAV